MSDLCIRHLLREHRAVEEGIRAFEQFLNDQAGLTRWGENEREDFRLLHDLFQKHLDRHMRKEEEILFPALESFLPRDLGPLAVLRGEHEDLRELFRRIQAAGQVRARRADDAEAQSKLRQFGSGMVRVLRDHIYKEDRILFPMVTRFLTPERDAELLRRMELIEQHKSDTNLAAAPGTSGT
ncbi:MAG: hemerythrin domain-containing protein [Acidobacteria bacterium]|nr:hemerythrin domain-containing protein [Acidobacteriota bacterium]